MPKRLFKFQGFYGGINDKFSPRDLSPVQITNGQDIDISDLGVVKLMGAEAVHTGGTETSKTAVVNTGLFFYSTDRRDGADPHATPHLHENGESWILFPDTANVRNVVYKMKSAGTLSSDTIELDENGTGATDFEPVYYAVDGVVRVSDGNFGANNSNKWHGYINRSLYYDSDGNQLTPGGSAVSYDDWFTAPQAIAKPTRGLFADSADDDLTFTATGSAGDDTILSKLNAFTDWEDEIDSGEYVAANITHGTDKGITSWTDATNVVTEALGGGLFWLNDVVWIVPDPGTGFNLDVTGTGTVGTWPAGDYVFASTFIYDGVQESLLFEMSGTEVTIAATNSMLAQVIINTPYNERITGGRIYCKIKDSQDNWNLLIDISLKSGCRVTLNGKFEGLWGSSGAWSEAYTNSSSMISIVQSDDPPPETYEIINGFSSDQEEISVGGDGEGYKCACLAGNRKTYIAHIRMTNPDGEVETRGDLMLKSKANKFDTFLWEDRVEVSINDGDDITALVPFADRILQYKEKILYIINVSQDIEFLEDQFKFRGVLGSYQTVVTEIGVASVNDKGIFLYNGKTVIDLTEDAKLGQRKLDWGSSYFTNIADVSIGYVANKKQLIIVLDTSDEATMHNILIYDMLTQSFVKGYRKVGTLDGDDNDLTNMINDWNDDVTYAVIDATNDTLYFKKWNPAPTALVGTSFKLITKAEDFGNPDTRKIAYKVNVTHNANTGAAAVLALYYKTSDFESSSGFTEIGEFDNHSGDSQLQEFVITGNVEDFYSMQLAVASKTTGTIEAGFLIDEISIVVRDKVVA